MKPGVETSVVVEAGQVPVVDFDVATVGMGDDLVAILGVTPANVPKTTLRLLRTSWTRQLMRNLQAWCVPKIYR